jgi:antitoxin (DNA-binding transcriptional repressor) of toxin-antitoxin stability system
VAGVVRAVDAGRAAVAVVSSNRAVAKVVRQKPRTNLRVVTATPNRQANSSADAVRANLPQRSNLEARS